MTVARHTMPAMGCLETDSTIARTRALCRPRLGAPFLHFACSRREHVVRNEPESLTLYQRGVISPLLQKLHMVTAFRDTALLQHHDAVCIDHRGEAVRDHESGEAKHQPF